MVFCCMSQASVDTYTTSNTALLNFVGQIALVQQQYITSASGDGATGATVTVVSGTTSITPASGRRHLLTSGTVTSTFQVTVPTGAG